MSTSGTREWRTRSNLLGSRQSPALNIWEALGPRCWPKRCPGTPTPTPSTHHRPKHHRKYQSRFKHTDGTVRRRERTLASTKSQPGSRPVQAIGGDIFRASPAWAVALSKVRSRLSACLVGHSLKRAVQSSAAAVLARSLARGAEHAKLGERAPEGQHGLGTECAQTKIF
jgi:hypothetical protein